MGAQKEGVYQWRHNTFEGTAHLVSASSDSTDFTGNFTFECAIKSGKIKARVGIASNGKADFAKLITNDIYPKIIFADDTNPNTFVVIENIIFSETKDWEYEFEFAPDDSYFIAFSKSGSIHLTIGDEYKDGEDLKAGLEEIVAFRKQCVANPEKPKSK